MNLTPPTKTTDSAYLRRRIACALLIFSVATAVTSNGQSYNLFTRLVHGDGLMPRNLVQGTDGEFYGVGFRSAPNDGGSIFKVSPSGTVTPIYIFCRRMPCRDGKAPNGLVLASDGNFYGTTEFGGEFGVGTIFQLTPSGSMTTLFNFCTGQSCPSGVAPVGELVQGSDGALYGTTLSGGDHDGGTVFRFTLSGVFTTLYSFCSQSPNCADGTNPIAGLVQASNGLFYGTTSRGGATPGCRFFAGCERFSGLAQPEN